MPPIYEFKCSACSHEFEELTSYSGRETTACPKCETLATPKLSATAGHRYYGPPDTGFHKTSMKAP